MADDNTLERIRKLLARTTENGCTEAEAMSAAAMAAKLMDRYNLSDADVIAGQTTATAELYARAGLDHAISLMGSAVAYFTGATIFSRRRPIMKTEYNLFGEARTVEHEMNRLQIVGLSHEVEIATYLLDICFAAMEGAAAKALSAENDERAKHNEPLLYGNERKKWVYDFQHGMVARMSKTLREMADERKREAPQLTKSSGTDLVVVRNSLVNDWLNASGIQLGRSRRVSVGNQSAFGAGHDAGGNVRFHAGVATGQRAVAALR